MAKKPSVEIEGAKELRRILKRIESKELKKAVSAANKASANVIAEEAKTTVPVVSGSLQKAIRATGSQASGSVKVGSAAVQYAGPIHYGWPGHNIEAQPFVTEALNEGALSEARDIYEELIAEVVRLVESKL